MKATFFVLGFHSQQLPQIVRRIHTEGHEIGNHGFYHERITQKSETWLRTDIAKADASIRTACGVTPKYFRPPGGIINQYDAKIVKELGHSVALWTLDTHDWDASSPSSIIRAVKTGAQPNAITLMQDGVSSSRHTVQALPSIIHVLRSSGYTLKILDMQS